VPPTPVTVTSGRPCEQVGEPRQVRLAPEEAAAADRQRAGGPPGGAVRGRDLVGEDRALELAGPSRRLEAELEQRRGVAAVGAQGVGLAPGPVQRLHQRAGDVLVQRVLGRQALEKGCGVGRAPAVQVRLRDALARAAVQVLQPPDLGLGDVGAGQLAEGGATPEPECLVAGAVTDERGEALGVDLARRDVEAQAGAGALDADRRQPAAQARQADRERARCRGGVGARPHRLEHRVDRYRPAGLEQQAQQDEALLEPWRRPRRRSVHLERPEHPELHRAEPNP
jgi:hypothetical protein